MWIWHLFISHWVMYLKSFTNEANYLRIYLIFMVTNCSREGYFPICKMVERTKEHHWTKQAVQPHFKD